MTVTTANNSKKNTMTNTGNPSITAVGLYKSDSHGWLAEKYTTDSPPGCTLLYLGDCQSL